MRRFQTIAAIIILPATATFAHNGVTVGHSPTSNNGVGECPTDHPMQLFLIDDPVVGGPILPGNWHPLERGSMTALNRIALNALLARPEFGGYVYVDAQPGFHFVDPSDACHAMTTAFTGGAPFSVSVQRTNWPDDTNIGLADSFGLALLQNDGDSYAFGTEAGAHFHPLWLAHRAGNYSAEFAIISDVFSESDRFSVSFVAGPGCAAHAPIDLTGVFNADVVDSDAGDSPISFDGQGRSWVLNGNYGTSFGIPQSGQLDVFQFAGLTGDLANALLDDGTRSSAASIDLVTQQRAARYESLEFLIGATGIFANADRLVVTMSYDTGSQQTVNIRRAVSAPRFLPLNDWRIDTAPLPVLSVGRSGMRDGGGFAVSSGNGIDQSHQPPDGYYMQRVTFPVDPLRVLQSIAIADYTGSGRIALFAITAIGAPPTCASAGCSAADIEPTCGDCDVDLADLANLLSNFGVGVGATRAMGDISGDDGAVALDDLALMLTSFGSDCR